MQSQRATGEFSELTFGGHDEGDNEAVESEHLGEDKDEDHANEQSRLLRCSTYSSISDNSDGKSSSKTGEADRQACSEVHKRAVQQYTACLQ